MLIKYMKRRLAMRRTYDELSRLTDRELYDLGISRGTIGEVVRKSFLDK